MKIKLTKITSLLLTFILVCSIFAVMTTEVSAVNDDLASVSSNNGTSVGDEAGISDFIYTVNDDGTATITKYNGNDALLVIPNEIDGHTVTEIRWDAFSGCTSLINVVIPDSVTYIGESAFDKCDKLTIYGYSGSYVQTYADSNNIPFVEITNNLGDVNLDSRITISDVTLIQKYLTGYASLNSEQLKLADYNEDGRITISDATLIQKSLAKKAQN